MKRLKSAKSKSTVPFKTPSAVIPCLSTLKQNGKSLFRVTYDWDDTKTEELGDSSVEVAVVATDAFEAFAAEDNAIRGCWDLAEIFAVCPTAVLTPDRIQIDDIFDGGIPGFYRENAVVERITQDAISLKVEEFKLGDVVGKTDAELGQFFAKLIMKTAEHKMLPVPNDEVIAKAAEWRKAILEGEVAKQNTPLPAAVPEAVDDETALKDDAKQRSFVKVPRALHQVCYDQMGLKNVEGVNEWAKLAEEVSNRGNSPTSHQVVSGKVVYKPKTTKSIRRSLEVTTMKPAFSTYQTTEYLKTECLVLTESDIWFLEIRDKKDLDCNVSFGEDFAFGYKLPLNPEIKARFDGMQNLLATSISTILFQTCEEYLGVVKSALEKGKSIQKPKTSSKKKKQS